MTFSMLTLGFVIGMRHAFEADHVAALASLATRTRSFRETIKLGVVWGVGHTLTLFAFGGVVLSLGAIVPEVLAKFLELSVGIMLIILGLDVIRRFVRQRARFMISRDGDPPEHLDAHPRAFGVTANDHPDRHERDDQSQMPIRALMVGLMHGMAGSAALILLTVQSAHHLSLELLYIALFGLGSIAGMAALSALITIPLCMSAGRLIRMRHGLHASIGAGTIILGFFMAYQIGVGDGLLLNLN